MTNAEILGGGGKEPARKVQQLDGSFADAPAVKAEGLTDLQRVAAIAQGRAEASAARMEALGKAGSDPGGRDELRRTFRRFRL